MKTIVDTGPLVSLLLKKEAHHDWARQTFDRLQPPMFSCEAVLTETLFLLGHREKAIFALQAMLQRDFLRLDFSAQREHEAVFKLMSRFVSVPMAFADACLVRMSEMNKASRVLTFDSDFHVYRRNGREVVPTLMP